jgi:hypothetical protein
MGRRQRQHGQWFSVGTRTDKTLNLLDLKFISLLESRNNEPPERETISQSTSTGISLHSHASARVPTTSAEQRSDPTSQPRVLPRSRWNSKFYQWKLPCVPKSPEIKGLSHSLREVLGVFHINDNRFPRHRHRWGINPTSPETPFGEPLDLENHWISLDTKMDLQTLPNWDVLCKLYSTPLEKLVYPLAMNSGQDIFVLLRARGRNGRLFVACMSELLVYHLGDGDYARQLGRLKRRIFFEENGALILRRELDVYFTEIGDSGRRTNRHGSTVARTMR